MWVRLTPQARRDLFAIWHHIADQSLSAADAVVRRVEQRYLRLSDFPDRGVPRPDLHIDARALIIERWVILYRVLSQEVQVVRIVDGTRNLPDISIVPDEDEA
jgi:toxin ParE1/3/4